VNLEFLRPVADHLWQSTLFVALAGLLTLALGKNRARVRYGVWLAASCKFLIPISALIALGGHLAWLVKMPATAPQTQSVLFAVVYEVSQPFTVRSASPPVPRAPRRTANLIPVVLPAIWACGVIGILCSWWVRWRRVRAMVRAGSPVELNLPIRAMTSPNLGTPGLFGVFRPMLLLPEGIRERLSPEQMSAIAAHELCHARYRDNLTAALQMFTEAVFWFHPLVWWVGKRIVEERERACDEEVLRLGSQPRVYADAILDVCRHYVKSPLMCSAGGENLKNRIEDIMTNRNVFKLNVGRKLLLAGAGILAVAGPVALGLVNASHVTAQSVPAKTFAFEAVSVKPIPSVDRSGLMPPTALPGGRFVSKFPLSIVISYAYKLPFNPSVRLSGVPNSAGIYDIEATGKIPGGLTATERDERMRSMVQTLLADRFKLAIHRETREMPVYALVVGKGGPKLQKADIEEKDCPDVSATPPGPSFTIPDMCHLIAGGQGRGLHARAVNMQDLASYVENWAGRPLLDKTGIQGLYRIETKGWLSMELASGALPPGAKAEDGSEIADLPTLFQVFEHLGLKMESQNDKVDVYVVDHVEKPSEN
jgi:uncharacterized protein (TIGR03435 family)